MSQPEQNATPELFWNTMSGFQRSATIKAAVELEIFTRIAEGNTTAAEIASAAGASQRGVRILCDSLTTLGFLTKSGSDYSLTASSAMFLDKRSQAYAGDAVHFFLDAKRKRDFDDLTNAVIKGGSNISDDALMDAEGESWVTFARSMAPLMFPTAQAAAANLGFDTNRNIKVLDIATGHGIYGLMVAKRYPNAEIYGADWENVLEVAKENAAKFGVADRYHTIPGDAFESDLGSGYDVVLIPNFLHHFDKETCEKFMRKVADSLKDDGEVVTVEFVPNEDRVSPPAPALFALIMLAETPGGDAYTFSEYKQMFENSGFSRNRLIPLDPMPQSLILSAR